MKRSIFRVPIIDVKYETIDRTTKCKITWLNPISGGNQTSIGISRCNPDDKFDKKFGERLAESRAKSKVYDTYTDCIRDACAVIILKHKNLIINESFHEQRLLKEDD